jgi:hypothetical protein
LVNLNSFLNLKLPAVVATVALAALMRRDLKRAKEQLPERNLAEALKHRPCMAIDLTHFSSPVGQSLSNRIFIF